MAERLYRDIGEHIKDEIRAQGLKPGAKLPTERVYADQYGVSRTVVREAFIMLEIEELIEVRKGSGSYLIKVPGDGRMIKSFAEDIGPFELLQARQVLESSIAACAAQVVTKHDIQLMQETLDLEGAELDSIEKSDAADREFHLLIARSTQNSLLLETCTQLWDLRERSPMWKILHSRIKDTSYRGQWLDDHREVLAHLRRRNAEGARQAMWQHLENVKVTLFALSNTEDPDFDGFLFTSLSPGQKPGQL
ncbi:FCD domain-containing protein [Marinobacterium rhizophilum]|uniref:FCD domain-containing protein n=1 Tax=Marinobacterium rhizophilum TaxID=420402 RepID=UPI0003828531|nr:FCD domain-containing protein [Marinobacterium rhizophilum]